MMRASLVKSIPTLPAVAAALVLLLVPFDAAAQERATLSGRVLSTQDEPVSAVVVRLVEAGRNAVTGEDGRYRFDELGPGRYLVRVEDDRYGSAVERVQLAAGETRTLDLRLNPLYHVDELVVTASPGVVTRDELYQAAQALSGERLRREVEASLGETVSREPGVNASYFGPASSRPVIRGLGSDRVRVLESGVGSGDLSANSPDHAVAVEPHAAERIEIVRGPATLLYGSSAIGGVVNVLDGRIPTEVPTTPVTGEIRILGATVSEERTASGELDAGVGPFVVHGSGTVRRTNDYDIPGFAEADHAEEEPGQEEEEEVEGVLPNSGIESSRLSGGVSWIGEDGHVGISVSGYDNLYGVPGAHGHHEEEGEPAEEEPGHGEEEGVSIDMQQRRFDFEGALRTAGGFLRSVKARVGFADYEHVELEGTERGTVFTNESWEGRIEAAHTLGERLDGAVGIQASTRDFSAIGEEAFVPPNQTDLLALFLFEELQLEPVSIQVGARWEGQSSTNAAEGFDVEYDGVSVSGGVNWNLSEPVGLAVSVARSVKLPSAEELFSNGPHLATRSFEIGDPTLSEEVGLSFDATVRIRTDRVEGELTGFVNSFDDFIYQQFTGREEDELPVLIYTQDDARFEGFEASLHYELLHRGNRHLELELWSDYVRATLTDPDEPLPRIPPLRLGAGFHWEENPWSGIVRVRRIAEQDRTAENEEATEGYTMLDAHLGYQVVLGGLLHEITLSGRNLLDREARNHISLLKEQAPLPGRDVRLTYRLRF